MAGLGGGTGDLACRGVTTWDLWLAGVVGVDLTFEAGDE